MSNNYIPSVYTALLGDKAAPSAILVAPLPVTSLQCLRPMRVAECEELLRAEVLGRPRPWSLLSTAPPSAVRVVCRDCALEPDGPKRNFARAFFEAPPGAGSRPGTVVLCANRLQGADALEGALVHELVHAVDHSVRGLDLTDCEQLARSELRAARAAECGGVGGGGGAMLGMCRWAGVFDAAMGADAGAVRRGCDAVERACVRDHALRSTRAVFPARGAGCVEAAFRACWASAGAGSAGV